MSAFWINLDKLVLIYLLMPLFIIIIVCLLYYLLSIAVHTWGRMKSWGTLIISQTRYRNYFHHLIDVQRKSVVAMALQ